MAKAKKIIKIILPLIFLTFYSLQFKKLRDISIEKIPTPEILDEFDFVWTGKSFLSTGIPTGWSDFSIYKTHKQSNNNGKVDGFSMTKDGGELITLKNKDRKESSVTSIETVDYGLGDRYLNFVSPYFDHPIFASIIYAFNTSGDQLNDIKPEEFRKTPIYLSVLTGILVFILATQIWGVGAGVLSFLVYSTVPSFLFLTRLSLAENVIAPLLMFSLISLQLFKRHKKNFFLILSGFFAGLCSLSKLPGTFMIIAGAYYLYSQKKYKKIPFFLIPALFVFLLYPLYGLLFSPDLFLNILLSQSGRGFSGPINLVQQIIQPTFKSWFPDLWWTGSWLISFLQLKNIFKNKKTNLLGVSFILLTLVTTFMSSANYPWYYLSIIPLLSVFVGKFILDTILYFSKTNLFLSLVFLVSGSFHWGYYVLNESKPSTSTIFKILVLIFTLLILFEEKIKKPPLLTLLTRIFLILLFHRLFLWNTRSITYILSAWPL